MIVLHGVKGAPQHGVLKIMRAFESRNLAGEPLAHTEVTRSPSHLFAQAKQARRHTPCRQNLFPEVNIAFQMHFHTARQIKAPLNRRMNRSEGD